MQFTYRFITGWIAVTILTGTARLSADEPPDQIDPANIIEKFNAARDGVGHLTLPVTIGNKEYLFVLDTGSAWVAYDSSFRAMLWKAQKQRKRQDSCWQGRTGAFRSTGCFSRKASPQNYF